MFVHMSAGTSGGQKRVLGLLELELQVVLNCLTWVLATKVVLSVQTVSAFNP